MRMAWAAAAVMAAGLIGARAFAADEAAVPSAGQQAPTFTLPSQTGQPTSLSSFHGKWVVLYFYPKDGTSGCTREAHEFQADAPKYEKANAVIVGVSVDSVDSHKQFCAKEGLNFHLLSDANKQVAPQYGSLADILGIKIAKRNTFLINPEGKIVKVWTGVNPSQASSEVLDELAADQKRS